MTVIDNMKWHFHVIGIKFRSHLVVAYGSYVEHVSFQNMPLFGDLLVKQGSIFLLQIKLVPQMYKHSLSNYLQARLRVKTSISPDQNSCDWWHFLDLYYSLNNFRDMRYPFQAEGQRLFCLINRILKHTSQSQCLYVHKNL